jgi:hypothetical protein
MDTRFNELFSTYIQNARAAVNQDRSERQLVALFTDFVSKAFDVDVSSMVFEQAIHIASIQRRGFIDVLFGDLVVEFKRQIVRNVEEPREQLKRYMRSLQGNYTGLLTDGLRFEAFRLDEHGDPRPFDQFNLAELDADAAYARLDGYLFSQRQKPPTSIDIVSRFGSNSPTFQIVFRGLRDLLACVDSQPTLGVWREQWRKLLSKVYGSNIGSDDLFLRHTYLCQFARLLAYAALKGIPESRDAVREIITGDAFKGYSVDNIGENDFFSWVLMPQIADEATELFYRLSLGLVAYDLSRIDQDLLKQLYQNLVDPETRHDLGEYYTPDWLAELTLEDIGYAPGQSLLDPACGSGSFLFAAIKKLAAGGLTGWPLVEFAVENVMGMDVHPLAVTVARINYLLALSDHMQAARGRTRTFSLPVYMADALVRPLENHKEDALVVPVDDKRNERFYIPLEAASRPAALTDVIDKMDRFARRSVNGKDKPLPDLESFSGLVREAFGASLTTQAANYWRGNLTLLAKLIYEDRNGIWSYILKNLSRPLVLAERKFDVVAGNPPWLSYRYIKSREYQREVKRLYQYYKLIDSDDVKLFTQMDLSTLFFAHARDRYLKNGGTLAFVMPRAVITGAKQHRPFQSQGVTRVIDLLGVFPLFNVPTCVLIREGDRLAGEKIPAVHYKGRLKAHEMSLIDAAPALAKAETTIRFVDSNVRSPYYYARFKQGATLVPRNLCFVKPQQNPNSPAVMTDPDADKEAKAPYKGIVLRGVVEDDYLYATLLSKHLIPFGYEKLHLVALPAYMNDGALHMMNKHEFAKRGHFESEKWFSHAEEKWSTLKKTTTPHTLAEYLNFRNKLIEQQPIGKIKVVYTASGVHLAACVVDTSSPAEVYGRQTNGFAIDSGTYFYETNNANEAHFLSALLNAPSLDEAIKAYQPRGKGNVGERHIQRTPFEACAIPPFDPANPDHCELARLSREAHATVEMLKMGGGLKGGVVSIRRAARAAAAAQIAAIDVIARRVLGL